jgi:hypothetical protein
VEHTSPSFKRISRRHVTQPEELRMIQETISRFMRAEVKPV